MKRIVGILTLAIVLAAGAALAQQQTPAQPSPEQGHRHIDGGLCPMMGGGMMSGGMMGMCEGSPTRPG